MVLILVFNNEDSDNMIILGDFNATLNAKLDIISGDPHSKELVDRFNTFVQYLQCNDIFRLKHPTRKAYTWSRKCFNKPMIARRLDYIF